MENSSRLGGGRFSFARRIGVVLAIGCFGLAVFGSASAQETCGPDAQYPCTGGDPRYYPVEIVTTTTTTTTTIPAVSPPTPTTTTTIAKSSPPPPLPKTGSSGIGDSLMVGGTVALSGIGLVIVSRRRRRDLGAA